MICFGTIVDGPYAGLGVLRVRCILCKAPNKGFMYAEIDSPMIRHWAGRKRNPGTWVWIPLNSFAPVPQHRARLEKLLTDKGIKHYWRKVKC